MQYTVPGPTSLADLAAALKNDPDLIFQYVYNNVEFFPMYGVQKGAFGTLIDGAGGPWDQCALLVALLTQAGYSAVFAFGRIELDQSILTNWFGTDTLVASQNLLTNLGMSFTTESTALAFDHIWVQAVIGGVTYAFDPSFKTYSRQSGVNLSSATGYNHSALIAAASTGATASGSSVRAVNRAGVRTLCDSYALNLRNYVTANCPTAGLDTLVGNKQIVQSFTPQRNTELSYQVGSSPTTWTSIPNSFRSTLRVQMDGLDQTLYSDQICHQDLRVNFIYTGEFSYSYPQLTLNGNILQTGTTSGEQNVTYTLTNNANGYTENSTGSVSYPVRLEFMWGLAGQGAIAYHNRLLNLSIAPFELGDTNGNFDHGLTETGLTFAEYSVLQTYHWDVLGRITNSQPICFFHGGLVGTDENTDNAFLDLTIGSHTMKFSDLTADPLNNSSALDAQTVLNNGCEGLAVRQAYDSVDANTNRAIDVEMANGGIVYDLNASNFSGVSGTLTSNNWQSDDLATLENWIDGGARCLVVQNGEESIPDGRTIPGAFYAAKPGATQFAAIFHNLKGVFGPLNGQREKPTVPAPPWPDPVNSVTGDYTREEVDLTIGSMPFPYSLSFVRYYNSAAKFPVSPNYPESAPAYSLLGPGWTHNWEIWATLDSDTIGCFTGAAVFSAPILVEMVVLNDLLSNPASDPLLNVVICALVDRWKAELVTNNVIRINSQYSDTMMLAGADYLSTCNSGATVSISGSAPIEAPLPGTVTYTTKDGQVLTFSEHADSFDSDLLVKTWLTNWTFPNGPQINLTYNEFEVGIVSSVSNNFGHMLTFSQSSPGSELSVSDGNGRSYSYAFNNDSVIAPVLASVTDTLGDTTSYGYSEIPIQYLADPNNVPASYLSSVQVLAMTAVTLPISATPFIRNGYNSSGQMFSQTTPNGVYRYYFAGYRCETIDPVGNDSVQYRNLAGSLPLVFDNRGNLTARVFDGFQQMTSVTFPEGNGQELTFDGKGNTLTVTNTPKPGSGLSNVSQSYAYNSTWNKVATITDPFSNVTSFSYDSYGNLSSIVSPTVNGQNPSVSLTFDGYGRPLTSTYPDGVITQFAYTGADLTSAAIDPSGLNLTQSMTYDSVGNKISVTDANGNATTSTFDTERNVTVETDALSNQTQWAQDTVGDLVSFAQQLGSGFQTTRYAYSAALVQTSETEPNGGVTNTNHDAINRVSSVKDAASKVFRISYDADSSPTSFTNPLGGVVGLAYSSNGLLSEVTNASGDQVEYANDGFDRLSRTTFLSDSGEHEDFTFDSNNNVLTWTGRSGNDVSFSYDALNRMATKSPEGGPTVSYGYDLCSRLVAVSTPPGGNPSTGTFSFVRDNAGRITSATTPDSKTISVLRDKNGNITKITWPDGYYLTRSYDALNRLVAVYLNGASSPALSFAYDQLSRRTALTYANGVVANYAWSIGDDLTQLQFVCPQQSLQFNYKYNLIHQEIGRTASSNALLWAPPAAGTSVSLGPSVLTYDEEGNVAGYGDWVFEYDIEKHLLQATNSEAGVDASYLYDPLERLTLKTVNGTTTRFLYFGFERIANYDGSGNLISRYIYGAPDEPLIAIAADGTLTYFLSDRQHSVVAATTGTGVISSTYAYSPFGQSSSVDASGFGFTGQRFDAETGLYYFKRRYYSPTLGQFLQEDPNKLLLNPYTYCFNDPLNQTDPDGGGPTFAWITEAVNVPYVTEGHETMSIGDPNGSFVTYSTAIGPDGKSIIVDSGPNYVIPNGQIVALKQVSPADAAKAMAALNQKPTVPNYGITNTCRSIARQNFDAIPGTPLPDGYPGIPLSSPISRQNITSPTTFELGPLDGPLRDWQTILGQANGYYNPDTSYGVPRDFSGSPLPGGLSSYFTQPSSGTSK